MKDNTKMDRPMTHDYKYANLPEEDRNALIPALRHTTQHTLKESGLPQTQTERDIQAKARHKIRDVCENCRPLPMSGTVRLCPLHRAAPELLEVLRDCYDTFCGEAEYINGCSTRDMADKCRAAIARAEGRAQ